VKHELKDRVGDVNLVCFHRTRPLILYAEYENGIQLWMTLRPVVLLTLILVPTVPHFVLFSILEQNWF
jgi:hypothetical protein